MKRSSTIFLQTVIVLIGIGVFALMLWEPNLEGVNAHATLFQIYFQDPFLAYVYASSIAFFVGLYQAFKVLGYIRGNKAFSQETVNALRTIKYCALATGALIIGALIFIFFTHGNDDAAGAFSLGMMATFASVVIAVGVAVSERLLQSAVDLKSENDLTV